MIGRPTAATTQRTSPARWALTDWERVVGKQIDAPFPSSKPIEPEITCVTWPAKRRPTIRAHASGGAARRSRADTSCRRRRVVCPSGKSKVAARAEFLEIAVRRSCAAARRASSSTSRFHSGVRGRIFCAASRACTRLLPRTARFRSSIRMRSSVPGIAEPEFTDRDLRLVRPVLRSCGGNAAASRSPL